MPLYIGDYLADTMHLSGPEHGAYLLLIMHYWRNGPLPDDDRALATIARTERKDWAAMAPTIRAFFRLEEGRLRHKRVDHELGTATAHVEQRRAAGRASAEARKRQREPNEQPNGGSTTVGTSVGSPVKISLERNGRPSPSPSPSPKEDSELRSESVDAKTALFREGLATLSRLTGKPPDDCRAFLGQLCKHAKQNHAGLLELLNRAASDPPAHVQSWLTAAAKALAPPANGHSLFDAKQPAPEDWMGLNAWTARQRTELGTKDGEAVRCIGGYALAGTLEDVVIAINGAGATLVQRPNLDALATWCQHDLPAHDAFLPTIRRVAASLREPVRSLAVFDAALRERIAA